MVIRMKRHYHKNIGATGTLDKSYHRLEKLKSKKKKETKNENEGENPQ